MANIPLRPWANEATVMAPRLGRQMQRNAGHGQRDSRHQTLPDEEEEEREGLNLHGQVLAWSVDGRWGFVFVRVCEKAPGLGLEQMV